MNNAPTGMGWGMMDGMSDMMWGMGLVWLLVAVMLVLAIAVLIKYVFSGRR